MEHNPLTIVTAPIRPSNLFTFCERVLRRPWYETSGCDRGITLNVSGAGDHRQLEGDFQISIYETFRLKGKFFRSLEQLLPYLTSKGIALNHLYVDQDRMPRHRGSPGSYHVLIFEEFLYNKSAYPTTPTSSTRLKSLLTVGPAKEDGTFQSFFETNRGSLYHYRTKELIPEDTWIPLYRTGSLFQNEEEPINLETCEHVIF